MNKNVTIYTGNIDFSANMKVNGNVTEGVKVNSDCGLLVRSGVFNAYVGTKITSEL